MQAFEFNTGAYYKDANGQLYFGGLDGVNWFDPNTLTKNEAKPKTVISKFEIFGRECPMAPNITLPYNQNTVTFTFAALHFSQPDQNLYKYKLVNHDSDWTFPDHNNVAHYTNLPPNNYTLLVLSSNYDGEWDKVGAKYSFEILKPWYAANLARTVLSCRHPCGWFS
ncbi:MAG: triple tyrosine motif-containing protein [Gelidibacter sp.]